jgi:hypothetical protein
VEARALIAGSIESDGELAADWLHEPHSPTLESITTLLTGLNAVDQTTSGNFTIDFLVHDSERFDALVRAFEALKHDKEIEQQRDEEDWLLYFDDEALTHFWWPTAEERRAYWLRYQTAPRAEVFQDEPQPPWDLLSMIDAIYNGDYALISCVLTSPDTGRLEFYPYGWPFGGTESLHALVEAFGFEMVDDSYDRMWDKFRAKDNAQKDAPPA